MKKWTKEHARLIGRIIFADFLGYPLRKYREFIETTETSLLFDRLPIKQRRLSRARTCPVRGLLSNGISRRTEGYSPKVVAEIASPVRNIAYAKGNDRISNGARNSEDFSIRYTNEGFNKIYDIRKNLRWISENSRLFYKLRRISSRNELTHRILKKVIKHQREYLKTGNLADLVPLSQVQLPIDNSWTSRLVNRLSVITPSGEEKPLKWFLQTQKDINKRLIKQLLDKENEVLSLSKDEDIESGRLKKPLTDNQIRAKLESEYGLSLSRWSVGHCRKDMGIPPAKRRLSGYKYPPLSANFSMLYPLVLEEVLRYAPSGPGIYEFRLKGREMEYPNSKTQVIYIGSTRNIRKRLREHLGRNSKNGHIRNFLKKYDCSFRYIQFSKDWKEEEGRLYKLFVSTYGAPPRCNRVRP